ncbi:hypothetical protein LTR17_018453 [Elasticomyces elasticus]|nr:hypothetical protein LTR17_018453 [Elasticomyces elasticus]
MHLLIEGLLAQRRISTYAARRVNASWTVQQHYDDDYRSRVTEADTQDSFASEGHSDGTGSSASTFSAPPLQQWRTILESQPNFYQDTVAVSDSGYSSGSQALFESSSAPSDRSLSQPLIKDNNADFIVRQQRLLADGWPVYMVIGPDIMVMDGLFSDEYKTTPPWTLSQWVAQIASQFDCLGVPERLGLILLCGRYLKARCPPA